MKILSGKRLPVPMGYESCRIVIYKRRVVIRVSPSGASIDRDLNILSLQLMKHIVAVTAISQIWTSLNFPDMNFTKFHFVLKVKRGLDVTLSKSKEGPLQVKSIEFYAKSPDKKVTDLERFQCGAFDIGGSKLPKETKQCATGFSQIMQSDWLMQVTWLGLSNQNVLFQQKYDNFFWLSF